MEQNEKQPCCGNADAGAVQPCCGPGSAKKSPLKTILSIALVLAALAVAGYAFFCKGECRSGSSESCPSQQK
ncbi:MAG: hypothetical protein A2268_08310 [Candidatus Raymondbacteria bacterium RifOxyA12_full_50_37]|uniref:Uncharacterized protein n=1 Tax=Candidatus Raymondbacteria bacterium RIFOXYD12_FULL_49_13 TaxID=1817890 RepID=A0A1F7F471_UNCRA|nr:MAG: hypothetical protein A2268_08310 [Candidatus Raymondbacteria bacterium RifOxyA12_full_50_37]OGJ90336.1 MAG: hypothetical protein A2248_17245 [Candidatus Raymondbacteria bacterium RIFOXYA2_FULL_49_16]OGJ99512.1 MAG: hypothetical protein A2350_00715 [Candidatus Raymondbacteria bacterium RifOxyB12_full_50_8]OGK01327.1 MAG: hypothetical protein A2519_13075 [Candidatus Raymondbacteria bacterium RIFOXYD12_FULL_49_13]OGK07517.1 MAG: hypothetical protein A2487_11380 [Candidatus Raymondbacteria 